MFISVPYKYSVPYSEKKKVYLFSENFERKNKTINPVLAVNT